MRCMTTRAPFGLDWHVFVNKRSSFVGVTLETNSIPIRSTTDLAQCPCAVDVMAVAALNEAFVHAVPKRFGEIRFGGSMASVTKQRLFVDQQKLFGLRVMRRV